MKYEPCTQCGSERSEYGHMHGLDLLGFALGFCGAECFRSVEDAKMRKEWFAAIQAEQERQRRLSRDAWFRKKEADNFYRSPAWRRLRYEVLQSCKGICMACGRRDGEMHVDHIKPRSKYPELELEFTNLQVLCDDCNLGKGNWDQTDWREQDSA